MPRVGELKSYPRFRAWCDACGAGFGVPRSIPESAEMVLRSASLAHHVLVNVDEDAAYNQIWEFVCQHPEFSTLIATLRVQLSRKIFASFCDPAPDSTLYSFYFPENCPRCRSPGFHFGPGIGPPMALRLEQVGHSHWDATDAAQRRDAMLSVGRSLRKRDV